MSEAERHFHTSGRSSGPSSGSDPETVDADIDESSQPARRIRRRQSSRALITDAVRSPEQNRRSRERQYAVLQGLRIPFILASIAAAFYESWVLASLLFVISVPLPWIAVVLGNAHGDPRDSRTKNVYKPAAAREYQRLEAQRSAELTSGDATGNRPTIIDHDDSHDD